ncbi:MAG: hypothetical protein LUI15_01415 [Firmicutes bacterium]|nr:hypothetical protein [Bacillota bacterium]
MTRLEKMLLYVSEHNEFYKKRIAEYGIKNPLDITQYPVLTRRELQENRYNMFSDGYKSKYYNQQLKRQSSSGSTGIPVSVFWERDDYALSMLPLWRARRDLHGILPSDKVMKFITSDIGGNFGGGNRPQYYFESKNILNVKRASLLSEESYTELVETIDSFSPRWLYIQPSVLHLLSLYYMRSWKKPPLSIKYIESVGETLTGTVRREALDVFGIPVTNMYGSEEMNCIAYECGAGHMHVIEENVFVEASGDGAGYDVITNLCGRAMPLIRYEQGDIITLDTAEGVCGCGLGKTIIKSIEGRTNEKIKVGGYELDSLLLTSAVTEVNNIYRNAISEFYFTFSPAKETLVCHLFIRGDERKWYGAIAGDIISLLRRSFGELKLETVESTEYSRGKGTILEVEK